VLGPLCATVLIGVLGTRGVLRWTLLPGLTAAVCFAFLAPAAKKEGHLAASPFTNLTERLAQMPQPYWRYLGGVLAHGIGDFAPTLLILRASQILTPRFGAGRAAAFAVGLYTFYNAVNALASYPAGALADRVGKRGLLAAGYSIGAATYIGFIFERPTIVVLAVLFGLAGVHGAVQQSVEKSLAAELLPNAVRGSGFGVLATTNGIGDLVSSIAVGALWSGVSVTAGFLYAGVFAAIGAVLVYSSRGR
jgi:sugar phosphate permease